LYDPPTITTVWPSNGLVKLLSIAVLLLASVSIATATPIQPDIKKLLSTPRPTQHFAPARVGWNGPEAATAAADAAPVTHFGVIPQRDFRQTLLQLAVPDWRIFLALSVLILLLRQLRKRGNLSHVPAVYNTPVDVGEPDVRRPAA
jgi:hypothetical protein